MSPALAGGFLTTAPPGKPLTSCLTLNVTEPLGWAELQDDPTPPPIISCPSVWVAPVITSERDCTVMTSRDLSTGIFVDITEAPGPSTSVSQTMSVVGLATGSRGQRLRRLGQEAGFRGRIEDGRGHVVGNSGGPADGQLGNRDLKSYSCKEPSSVNGLNERGCDLFPRAAEGTGWQVP